MMSDLSRPPCASAPALTTTNEPTTAATTTPPRIYPSARIFARSITSRHFTASRASRASPSAGVDPT